MVANLVSVEQVTRSFGSDPVLDRVSMGIGVGERIGVVGRNGGGKSTLLRLIAGRDTPDSGRITTAGHVSVGVLGQAEGIDGDQTVRDRILGDRAEHEWASQPRIRGVLDALLGRHDGELLQRTMGQLSGGERRRVELAAVLIDDHDLVVLDEPTNHLDVQSVQWLADYLCGRPRQALLVVTHDRWFLDAVTERTWEVVDGRVEEYDGGYSAYVLAKVERERQAAAEQARRANLMRKELAWLRRGAPARTTKPKFRVDAADELIAAEPPPRDAGELLRFAGSRLGRSVIDLEGVTVDRGGRTVLRDVTWRLGPGDRVAVLGVNGAGKSTLARVLTGDLAPDSGVRKEGKTVASALLSQQLDELDPSQTVVESVQEVARRIELAGGRELTAEQLCEQLGFRRDRQWTPVGDLSGGERRRLQLTRLLMTEPNVLILDEPTNDFDTETLAALEDLLDSFAGTLIVISHDRYFLERTCDRFLGLLPGGVLRDLPAGVDEYLRLHEGHAADRWGEPAPQAKPKADRTATAGAREARKLMARHERTLARLDDEEERIHTAMSESASDHERLAELNRELGEVHRQREAVEEEWLEAAERA